MEATAKRVSIEFTLTLDDGTAAATNVGKKPFVFQHGQNQLLPALESAMAGLEINDRRAITLSPEEGFGAVDPDAFWAVQTEGIPEESRRVGEVLTVRDNSETRMRARVHEIDSDMLVLDFNHPLAGKNLHFDVRVVAIEE
ncbi:MAG TPA: FKBP-type peptidyl-prolyl cis-trans isomerase [Thermoanaerobaculia bacterium]|jgi:FKBP-type peptidyl-prolyl cis-trans isomerase 2